MKIETIINIFIISILLTSCRKEEVEIAVYHFKNFASTFEEVSDTLYLTKRLKSFDNRNFEVYTEVGDDSVFRFAINPLTEIENKIIFFEDTCELVTAQIFDLKNGKIEISKYYYDRDNSMDEESYIYYNPEIGLIAIYNLGWFSFDYFDYNSTKGLLEKFKEDKTGFI